MECGARSLRLIRKIHVWVHRCTARRSTRRIGLHVAASNSSGRIAPCLFWFNSDREVICWGSAEMGQEDLVCQCYVASALH